MTAKIEPIPASSDQLRQGGMDRRIERRHPRWLKPAAGAAGVILVSVLLTVALAPGQGRILRVASEQIVVSQVVHGQFEDFIPVRGRATPLRTVYLDAIEGGRVEEVFVEGGTLVQAGAAIVRLSNTALQLDVIAREAEVAEQINNLHVLELSLEQNRLSHKRNLAMIDYRITDLTRQVERRRQLILGDHVSQSDLDAVEDELAYQKQLRTITLEAQQTDERLQNAQLVQIREAVEQLRQNLAFARRNLDTLNVRAPVSGQLTAFDVEVGQSLAPGERVGQIDDPDNFKLSATIDEFFLGRVDIGQTAIVNVDGGDLTLTVNKIHPEVRNGRFEVDLTFDGPTPDDIRRGQSLQMRLSLGDSNEAIMIPNGAFYQDTGGNWIFVVARNGRQAVRRTVRLGRRNAQYIEVVDGLEPGEMVVTSPYTSFLDMQRLEIAS